MRAVPKHHVHKHEQSQNKRSLGLAFLLISSFAILEILGATVSRSLTLLADAGHMILDASSLGLAWLALRIASRIHSATHSYGYHRFQVLAALVNGLLLLVPVTSACCCRGARAGSGGNTSYPNNAHWHDWTHRQLHCFTHRSWL